MAEIPLTWTDVIEELAARVTVDIEQHLDLDEDTLGILQEIRTWLLEQDPPGVKEDSDD